MIRAIITDYDGTLVDTFLANYSAYERAFSETGLTLNKADYRQWFGCRFDDFMQRANISDKIVQKSIREKKKAYYPTFFSLLRINQPLFDFIAAFHRQGGKTAVASTARRENLINSINFLGIQDFFDLIQSGEDTTYGKPHPQIYLQTMHSLGVSADETLIFEDSTVGVAAAAASGASYIQIMDKWVNYGTSN